MSKSSESVATPVADVEPFFIEESARWADMDYNQHMRNAAFLGVSEQCRVGYMAHKGLAMERFGELGIGPVVLEDRLTYKRELKLLDPFRVELSLTGSTRDGRRMTVRNTIIRTSDDAVAAVVESVVLWFDISARKPVVPPDELRAVWLSAHRASDFAWLDARDSAKA